MILLIAIAMDAFATDRNDADAIIDGIGPKTSGESRTNEEKNKFREGGGMSDDNSAARFFGEYAYLNFQEHQNV